MGVIQSPQCLYGLSRIPRTDITVRKPFLLEGDCLLFSIDGQFIQSVVRDFSPIGKLWLCLDLSRPSIDTNFAAPFPQLSLFRRVSQYHFGLERIVSPSPFCSPTLPSHEASQRSNGRARHSVSTTHIKLHPKVRRYVLSLLT